MSFLKILQKLYRQSPMDFYAKHSNYTVIRSTNTAFSLGYRFYKIFNDNEIDNIWQIIRIHKRFSVVFIFILFMILLYEFIFPKFALFVNNSWYVNAFIILGILTFVSQLITYFSTLIFEKILAKKFGKFEKVYFNHSQNIDEKYFSLFKSELTKALIALVLISISITFISPFEYTQKLIEQKRYNDAVKIATIGSKFLPIAHEWYSLRGFANFQLEKYNDAILDYDKAYQLSADSFEIMNFDNKIFVKYYLEDFDSALADFDNEIQKAQSDNERDQFLWDKAQFLYNTKKYNDALELYNTLITKAENDPVFLLRDRLYLERAEVYKKLNKMELAKLDVESAGIMDFKTFKNPIPKPMLMLDNETFYSY